MYTFIVQYPDKQTYPKEQPKLRSLNTMVLWYLSVCECGVLDEVGNESMDFPDGDWCGPCVYSCSNSSNYEW